MAHFFVIDLTYVSGLDAVEEHLQAHRDHLAKYYSNGTFLASGRKEPRTGGIILAQGERQRIEAAIAEDPFTVHGVAECSLTEFVPTMTGEALRGFTEES